MDVEINSDKRRIKNGFCGSLGYYLFERGYDGNLIIIRQKRGLPTAAAVAASEKALAAALAIVVMNAAVTVFKLSNVRCADCLLRQNGVAAVDLLTTFDGLDYEYNCFRA